MAHRKYRNIPTIVDGIRFDSRKEAKRWAELRLLEKAGNICDLHRQETFDMWVGGHKICKYVADFTYYKTRGDVAYGFVVEDVKSAATRKNPIYRIKKKLMKAIHGIEILET